MAGNKRSASEKAYHQREAARMYHHEAKTEEEIAEVLGISQSTVSRDLKELEKKWTREANKKVSTAKGKLLRELEYARSEAKGGWQRSQKNAESLVIKESVDGNETTIKSEGQAGDPRFLAILEKLIMDEFEIMGLADAQEKLPLSKDTLLMLHLLGYSLDDVARAFNEMVNKIAIKEGKPMIVEGKKK